jgi:hypothetical protein
VGFEFEYKVWTDSGPQFRDRISVKLRTARDIQSHIYYTRTDVIPHPQLAFGLVRGGRHDQLVNTISTT